MLETDLWSGMVRPLLLSFGIAERIENNVMLGMPDVIFCIRKDNASRAVTGFIELKNAHEWPKRPDTIFRFKHFSLDQKNFLVRWANHGCRCCVLSKVGQDYFLYSGARSAILYNGGTSRTLLANADIIGYGQLPGGKVIRWLTQD